MSDDIRNAYKFAKQLNSLVTEKIIDGKLEENINRSALVKLRRGLRDNFTEISPDILEWLVECVEDPKNYGKFALVGGLFANHSMPRQEIESLGKSFSRHKGSDSLEKRFKSLLEAQDDQLIKRLREIIGLAKSQEIPIHYGRLLHHLLDWDDPNQRVQFRWARDYWQNPAIYEHWKQQVEADWENEKKRDKNKSKRKQELTQSELQARVFVKYLQSLEKDSAALARLRRGLGKPYGTIDMLPYIAPFLLKQHWEYPAYFLTASLFALHPAYTEELYHNMGRVFYLLGEKQKSKEATQNLQRRFTALLDADQRDIAHHLRQVISEAKSAKSVIKINYQQLLLDLLGWGNPKKTVQRHWAKSFFFDPKSISNIA